MRCVHPNDEGLIASCLEADRDVVSRAALCPSCRDRLREIELWLEQVRDDLNAEADAQFGPERLARQHAAILGRLAASEVSARLLRFPARAIPTAVWTAGRRWIAAAAAAGLLIGVVAERVIDIGQPASRGAPRVAPVLRAARTAPVRDARNRSEEAFLIEIESALDAPRIAELRAIDAFTPRVREANTRR